ncbi:hypothetical protein KVR01_007281 [Diaporthe batatas]|uniref:uncharacterized protein n=1 Tax=Diaporthe batatas TaxID=748121 RepID=UPI001D056FC7|nr:uncharacterized protein KVR01_007281 [Diaporthe batatas]KAG8162803.1 hypothetical protein KVR01_007281 [Diaporthe batatas]
MSQLRSIPELLVRHAAERGQKVAYSSPSREITYRELEERTRRIAVHLAWAGVGRGDFVAVFLGRCLEALESILAITRAGAVGVPLDSRSTSSELSNALQHCGARAIFTDSHHLSQVRLATEGQKQTIIVVSSSVDCTANGESKVAQYESWAEDEDCTTSESKIDEDTGADPAFLHYTSGTTSSPKGVLSSQHSWLLSAQGFVQRFGFTEEDQFFIPVPLFHAISHSFCIFATLTVGASAHIPDPNKTFFDSLATGQAQTATIIVGPPASYHEIVATASTSVTPLALPRLRACMFGGAPATAALSAQVQQVFGVPLTANYGCTETCGGVCTGRPGDLFREGGLPELIPGVELKLVDPDGNEVKVGEQGEIWIRSPALMIGYYKEAKSPFTSDGWFPTGDLARESTYGNNLTLIGRRKEVIIRGGENIQPDEVEKVLLQCPGVTDVVVAGVPHRLLGETPVAFVVCEAKSTTPGRDAVDLDPSTLLAVCRRSLPEYKIPTSFYQIDAVPRTLLGKPKRSTVASCTSRPLTAVSKLRSKDSIQAMVLNETIRACDQDADADGQDAAWLHRYSDRPFITIGLTSLAGIVLRDRLSSLTGLDLPTTLVFDHPTPEAVSEHLYRRLLDLKVPSSLPIPMPELPAEDGGVEPIAIVSMACRYPGGISSPEDLWQIVSDGVDVTSEFPTDRGWNVETLYNPDPDHPGTSTTSRGAFLENMADFDAGLFGMSPREALATDPQQRLLLETTWELAERGGMAPSSLRGTQTGVFVGIMYGDYADNGKDTPELEAYLGIGSSGSVVSGRVSYCFGLHGPSLCIHTGCSSSLVAIHLAAASLRSGESSLAIAGGVTTMATPQSFVCFSKRRGLSEDGRCRAYSSDASGTGWSEGVGLVLLERLQDARRNGHQVLAVIRGSAVNSDGASNGLTAPSGTAQEQVIQAALAQAGLSPADVDVVEGHGTATALGDPVEVQALISAYGNGGGDAKRPVSRPLLLGSVKSNIGHTQAAAGVAGVIKMVKAIQHGIAPASLHINEPSRYVKWEGSGVEVLSKTKPWPTSFEPSSTARKRRAAISSFGIGGTNSHVVLEQPPEEGNQRQAGLFGNSTPPITPTTPKTFDKTGMTFPWILSGADEAALRAQARSLLETKAIFLQDPADIALSLATTRSALRHRASVTPTGGSYQAALEELAGNQRNSEDGAVPAHAQASATKPRVAFMFSGQGARLPSSDVLEKLCAAFPVFSDAFVEACDELSLHLECPLSYVLGNGEGHEADPRLDRTDFAQSLLFAFEVAMFRLLESVNIRPDFVTGHSLGEIAAAYASGALSLREAAMIVTCRGKLMADLPSNGIMVSVSASEEEVTEEISRQNHEIENGSVTIAAVNSKTSIVLSGTEEAVTIIAERLAGSGRRVTQLRNIRHAFHSPMMDPMLADLERKLEFSISTDNTRKSTTPLVSSVTGKRVEAARLRSTMHWNCHVCQPVRFSDAIEELQNDGVSLFVEIGPSAVLSNHVPGSIATHSQVNRLLDALGQVWVRGIQVDWKTVIKSTGANIIDLPVYPFQRQRYWLDLPKPATQKAELMNELGHGILFHSTSIPDTNKIICTGRLSTARQPWLRDHVVGEQMIVPAAALTELALRASRECTGTDESMMLDEFTFMAPVALNAEQDDELKIQVVIGEAQEHGARAVDVYSRPRDVSAQHEWTRHATGILKPASPLDDGGDTVQKYSESVVDERTRSYDGKMIDVTKAYGILAGAGIKYGPSFQSVRSVWRESQDELGVHIEPYPSQSRMYALHPALLDAAIHATLLPEPEKAAGNIRLPFLFRGVQIDDWAGSGALIARIRKQDENRFSLHLTKKATRKLVAVISEVVTRPWSAAESAAGDLYRLQWDRFSTSRINGESNGPSSDHYEVYRVRSDARDDGADEHSAVHSRVHRSVAEVLGVIQKWRAEKAYSDERLVIVTERASLENHPDLVSAAVWGFVRSAQAELGGGRIVLIDLDGSAESEKALASVIVSKEATVAVRKGTPMAPSLKKMSLPPVQNASLKAAVCASTLDISGTVLITGATGGLGALLSRHIVRVHGAKSLLLVSRSGTKAQGAAQMYDDLAAAGAVVRIEGCDCGDRQQLVTLLESISSRGLPPISAIIHCAGIVDDAMLSSQDPGRVSRVLYPKVDAAWHLHDLAPSTVRSFVLFSSFVGILGNEGQVAYSAGNAFLDGLARYRNSRGLPAMSLAWGPWLNEVGMASDTKLKAHSARLENAKPLTDQQGLQLFEKAMQRRFSSEPVMAPLLIEGPFPLISDGTGGPKATTSALHSRSKWRQLLSQTPVNRREKKLLELVRSSMATVLGYHDQDLPDRPLADLGFDSSSSVLLSNELRKLTGVTDLPVTLALDYETTQSLAQYLLGRLDLERIDDETEATAHAPHSTAENIEDPLYAPETDNKPSLGIFEPLNGEPECDREGVDVEAFGGLAALYKRLCHLQQYSAAAELLGISSLALPRFRIGSDLSKYAVPPQLLAAGPFDSANPTVPLVLLPSFLPPVINDGFRGSAYSTLAAAMKGQMEIFELPHPEVMAVPEDLETLAAIHVGTIKEHFTGPVVLAGFSAGGLVAHAVASRLLEETKNQDRQEARLAGLVLIDTYINMRASKQPEWVDALPAEALTVRNGGLLRMISDPDLALGKVGGYFRTLQNFELQPLPEALPTLFLRAQFPTANMPSGEDDWRPLWPQVKDTFDVPGSHLELLEKPCVTASAGGIRRWMTQVGSQI